MIGDTISSSITKPMYLFLILVILGSLALAPAWAAADEPSDGGVGKLGEMVVTATKTEQNTMDLPFFVSVVTREEIENSGARNLEQALRSVPGLQIGTQGNAYPHIEVRGFRDTKDLAVLIDGIPFRQVDGSADLTMLPLNLVERIEFVKGPSSAIWGRGAVAGVLNIITKPADTSKQQTKMQLGGGSFNTFQGDTRVVTPYDGGYVMLNAGGSTSSGFQDRTDRESYNALLQLNHKAAKKLDLGVQYLHSYVSADRGSIIPLVNGEPAYGVNRESNYGLDGATYNGRYQALSVAPTLKLSDAVTVKDVLTFSAFDRYATGGITITPKTSTKGWWETDSDQTSIHNDLNFTLKNQFGPAANTLLLGNYLEKGQQKSHSPSFSGAPTYGPPDWQTPLTNWNNPAKGIRGATTRSDYDQTIVSFYAQDRVDYGRFGFMAGVRYDNFDEELSQSGQNVKAEQSDSAWTPRFGIDYLAYKARGTELTLFANYVEGFRTQFPSLSTRNGVTLPQLLDPEETTSYEGGVKVAALDGRLFGQVSLFETEKKGPRSFRTSADDFLFTNARSRVTGLETEVRYNLSKLFSLWTYYTYHDAHHLEFTDSSGNSFAGYRVRMSPRHMAGAGVNFHWKDFNWNVSAIYVGDRNLRDNTVTEPQNLPSYTVVNTALGYTFGKYEVQFVVNNVFDEFYINDDFSSQDAGCAGEPLNFFVWLRANF